MLLGDFDKKHLKFFTYVHEILGSLLLVWFYWFCLPRKFSSMVSLLYLILTAVGVMGWGSKRAWCVHGGDELKMAEGDGDLAEAGTLSVQLCSRHE